MGAENKELTKDSIISTASKVFGRYGYKKTTLDDITSYLNIGKTAIYYYFKNKEEIFREVIKKEACELSKTLEKEIAKGSNPLEKFTNYVYARMLFLKHVGNYYSAMRYDLLEQLEFINETREDFDKIELETVKNLLVEGCKKGYFSIKDTTETASIITMTLKSLELPFFGSNPNFNYEPKLRNLTELFLNGMLTTEKRK